jgi:hypothetical protein
MGPPFNTNGYLPTPMPHLSPPGRNSQNSEESVTWQLAQYISSNKPVQIQDYGYTANPVGYQTIVNPKQIIDTEKASYSTVYVLPVKPTEFQKPQAQIIGQGHKETGAPRFF